MANEMLDALKHLTEKVDEEKTLNAAEREKNEAARLNIASMRTDIDWLKIGAKTFLGEVRWGLRILAFGAVFSIVFLLATDKGRAILRLIIGTAN